MRLQSQGGLRSDCKLPSCNFLAVVCSLACGQASEAHCVPTGRQPHGICVSEVLLCVCEDASMCGNVNLPAASFPPKPCFLLLQSKCFAALAVILWQGPSGIALLVGNVS